MSKVSRTAVKAVVGALAFWLFWMAGASYSARMGEVARVVPGQAQMIQAEAEAAN